MSLSWWLWFHLFVLPVLSKAVVANNETLVEDLIDWLRSRGGFFNSRLEIRRVDHDKSTSRYGVFAIDDINRTETLFLIPSGCLITSRNVDIGDRIRGDFLGKGRELDGKVVAVFPDGTVDVVFVDGDKERILERHRIQNDESQSAMECGTIRNLIQEMRLGDDSEFAPYVNYLLSQTSGQLPSAWSEEGQDLILDLLEHSIGEQVLPPVGLTEWLKDEWTRGCGGNDDPFEENVALLVVQRGWDEVLIPIYDMLNHRNGHWLNTESHSVHGLSDDGQIEVRASRDIQAGEEIYTTYNLCVDCNARTTNYGTPELFRDYGFVEDYPQRWVFRDQGVSFEIDEIPGADGSDSAELEITWISDPKAPSTRKGIRFLQEQLQRLREFAETELLSPSETIPKNEWDTVCQFHRALTTALSEAVVDIDGKGNTKCPNKDGDCDVSLTRYNELGEQDDMLPYADEVCNAQEIFSFPGYDIIEEFKSPYQTLTFFQDKRNKDTCLELDEIVQICGSYRPHYHEMVVHYTARFLDKIERVLWVGGGDSMLLHEILKYPTLELVVGLELDQKVTRHSFKHFGTQPHWDNDKVQWWYGDATKNLLMLPRDYFGSFDMVLVDLSETVMSRLVTNELDVMESLALLVKPDGIFVKNELYFGDLQHMFNYAVQIHYSDVPVICSQALVLGSNQLDFLSVDLKDHQVENLYVKPLVDPLQQFDLFHDYSHSSSSTNSCKHEQDDSLDEPRDQEKSSGVLIIVEAENAYSPTLQSEQQLKDALVKTLEDEKFTVVSSIEYTSRGKGPVVVIVLEEGYIVARTWPEDRYCAFDLLLWSSFEKHNGLKKALTTAVASERISSYRIVVGGMFGVSTWRNDEKNRGPPVGRLCNQTNGTVAQDGTPTATSGAAMDTIMEESLSLVPDKVMTVAVFCGLQTQPCTILNVLQETNAVGKVLPVWTCPNVNNNVTLLFRCEKSVLNSLRTSVTRENKIRTVVLDPSAPIAMGKVVHRIFSSRSHNQQLLTPDITIVAMTRNNTETWRRNLLERFRTDIIMYEPNFRTEVVFHDSSSNDIVELGATACGDEHFVKRLVEVTRSIQQRTGLESDIVKIVGGLWNYMPNFEPSQFSLPRDYNQSAPLEQWHSQRPVGHQTVFQLEQDSGEQPMESNHIRTALERALKLGAGASAAKMHEIHNVGGDGCVWVSLWAAGSVLVVWDGRTHVDVNLFSYRESSEFANDFVRYFRSTTTNLTTILCDEQPRGLGGVVNFQRDFEEEPRRDPHWA